MLVLVYSGSYASSLSLRSILEARGIRTTFEDLPGHPHGRSNSKIYVTLADVEQALPLVAEFRLDEDKRGSTRGSGR